MIDINQVIKEVAKETGIDKKLVNDVCKYVFQFTIDVMKDTEDYHEILFAKLFKFKLKPRFQEDKTKPYSPKIK